MREPTADDARPKPDACELLGWDTDFFGFRVARATLQRLTPESAAAIDRWSEHHGIRCTYLLTVADDPPSALLAHDHGFRCVDLRMTLSWNTAVDASSSSPRSITPAVRTVRSDDVPALEAIARVSHRDSRFYQDGRFPTARCDELYATWIRESCEGNADAVLVPDSGGVASGYVTCHRGTSDSPATIGLLAVGLHAKGRGVGRALVEAAQAWFQQAGHEQLNVVTQGRNVDAQRLYQACGFRTDGVSLWYHKWYSEENSRFA